MSKLRKKLAEAMKPRKGAAVNSSTTTKEIDSRYKKADRVMAKYMSEDSTSSAPAKRPYLTRRSSRPMVRRPVVRCLFSIPQEHVDLLEALCDRARQGSLETTKSEMVRAGLLALKSMRSDRFLAQLSRVDRIKRGRPGTVPGWISDKES